MIQTINPYASARTAEIMSRYRPIAPKPDALAAADSDSSAAVPTGISKSPYLRNVWAHLQARPTRTRKRGRSATFSPPSVKRPRACLQPYQVTNSPVMHGIFPQISLVPLKCGLDTAVAESVALPLFYRKEIDLNTTADQGLEELDLLPKLQEPVKIQPSVISPRPVRPVGSSIVVKSITDDPRRTTMAATAVEEVEEIVEAETVPAIVSDSSNKVRMSNSAYKEMVGQPECCWLDYGGGGGACKRIGGEVSLRFVDTKVEVCKTAAFTCLVKIEWESEGKKMCVEASSSALKLDCKGKDYQFLWRFHTAEEGSRCSASDN